LRRIYSTESRLLLTQLLPALTRLKIAFQKLLSVAKLDLLASAKGDLSSRVGAETFTIDPVSG
jgi:hypothetical protein